MKIVLTKEEVALICAVWLARNSYEEAQEAAGPKLTLVANNFDYYADAKESFDAVEQQLQAVQVVRP